jgi:hypothetical protein
MGHEPVSEAESDTLLIVQEWALQAGLSPFDFDPLAGHGKRAYIAAIHAAFAGDYAPLAGRMQAVIRRTLRL